MWKILENLVPNINDSVSCYYHPCHGRKCDIKSLTQRSKYNTIKDQQITVLGVKLFNIIPKSTRNMRDVNVDAFKKSLDSFLAKIPDEPSTTGHTNNRRGQSNSLVHMVPIWNIGSGWTLNHSS